MKLFEEIVYSKVDLKPVILILNFSFQAIYKIFWKNFLRKKHWKD